MYTSAGLNPSMYAYDVQSESSLLYSYEYARPYSFHSSPRRMGMDTSVIRNPPDMDSDNDGLHTTPNHARMGAIVK